MLSLMVPSSCFYPLQVIKRFAPFRLEKTQVSGASTGAGRQGDPIQRKKTLKNRMSNIE
jgi:hypothetical protein